ncbi:IS630 family transposase [Calditrichota bacterium]
MTVGYSTLCRNFHEWGYVQLRPRQHNVTSDPKKQGQHIKRVNLLLPSQPDLWFQDETAFWANPAPYFVWALKGSKPTAPNVGGRLNVNVMGAVRPEDGRFFAFIASHGNQIVFQMFLNQMQEIVNRNRRVVMILDNARFHHVKDLDWGCIEPWFLPPGSPELNPIETLWLVIKKNFFNQWVAKNETKLAYRVTNAIAYYEERHDIIRSVCAISKYL